MMCKIYKNVLLLTARSHFDLWLSPWKLQENDDSKHLLKLAVDSKVDEIRSILSRDKKMNVTILAKLLQEYLK